ncbi:MAG: penicillin-binding protein 2, partial [Eggerthellaceae bacterium]|nr:penicillin-binding protein 2 [Eggerthellaceae bacterium]
MARLINFSTIKRKTGESVSYQSARLSYAFVVCAVAMFGLIAWGLIDLQVVKAEEYSEMAKKSRTVSFETTPRRGTIYDRNGVVLAVSIDATTIYANPSEITEPHQTALALAAVLGGDVNTYKDKISSGSNTIAYIKRQADVEEANRVKELGLKGIYF